MKAADDGCIAPFNCTSAHPVSPCSPCVSMPAGPARARQPRVCARHRGQRVLLPLHRQPEPGCVPCVGASTQQAVTLWETVGAQQGAHSTSLCVPALPARLVPPSTLALASHLQHHHSSTRRRRQVVLAPGGVPATPHLSSASKQIVQSVSLSPTAAAAFCCPDDDKSYWNQVASKLAEATSADELMGYHKWMPGGQDPAQVLLNADKVRAWARMTFLFWAGVGRVLRVRRGGTAQLVFWAQPATSGCPGGGTASSPC